MECLRNLSNEEICNIIKNPFFDESVSAFIKEHFYELLENKTIDLFEIILSHGYAPLFEEAIQENIGIVLRLLVKKESVFTIVRFARCFPEMTVKNLIVLLIDNPEFYNLINRIRCICEINDYGPDKDKILDIFLNFDRSKNSLDPVNFFSSFISLLTCLNEEIITKNIRRIISLLNFLNKKIRDSLSVYPPDEIPHILNSISSISKKNPKIAEYFEKHLDIIISTFTALTIKELEEEGVLLFMKILFKEIMAEQSIGIGDIYATGGASSNVLLMGDRVFKINLNGIIKIPASKRILRPLIRTNIMDKEDMILFGIEIEDRLDTDNVTPKEIYDVFDDALNTDVFLTDCRKHNVGKLLRPNSPTLKGAVAFHDGKEIPYYVDDESIGFFPISNQDDEPLSAGECVLVDLEDAFYFPDFDVEKKIKLLRQEGKTAYKILYELQDIFTDLTDGAIVDTPLLYDYIIKKLNSNEKERSIKLKPKKSNSPKH